MYIINIYSVLIKHIRKGENHERISMFEKLW